MLTRESLGVNGGQIVLTRESLGVSGDQIMLTRESLGVNGGSNHVDTAVAGGQVPESFGPSTRCRMN